MKELILQAIQKFNLRCREDAELSDEELKEYAEKYKAKVERRDAREAELAAVEQAYFKLLDSASLESNQEELGEKARRRAQRRGAEGMYGAGRVQGYRGVQRKGKEEAKKKSSHQHRKEGRDHRLAERENTSAEKRILFVICYTTPTTLPCNEPANLK